MELIRISDRKLKIMLTPTDMCHFDLDDDCFEKDDERMHRSFRRLLEEVRDRIGFVADVRRISVQYFPSREGGCEMFISTSTTEACTEDSVGSTTPPEARNPRALEVHTGKRTAGSFWRDGAYRFSSLTPLLAVCRRLRQNGFLGNSYAYRDDQKRYYLLLSMLSSSPFVLPEELAFIVEYGEIENPSMLKLYVKEHAILLSAPHAVEELAPLA